MPYVSPFGVASTHPDTSETEPTVLLRLLGDDGIHLAEHESHRLPPQTAELLAYLELRGGRRARRPALVGALWPDLPESVGRRRLSRLLWRTNRSLPWELTYTEGETVHLTDSLASDWRLAEEALERVTRPGVPPRARDLEMLRQPLMSDVRSAWAEMHQAGWDERRFHALREAGHSLLAGGRPHEAAETATFLVSWEPLDEPSHLLLMRAFVEIGAPSRAAELFRDLRRRLRRELGVEPAPELAAVAGQPAYGT